MKIALLGTRGIPASYSGFETCVEELGKRLVARGHQVSVYCRSHHIDYPDDTYLGMELIKLPTIQNKYLDTLVHSFLSSIHALTQRFDAGIYFIAGNSPVTWIPRMVGTKTVLNVDGLDWKREKWPRLAKAYIRFAEWLATFLPNRFLTDSKVVQSYYSEQFNIEPPFYIPYGSEVQIVEPGETLARYDLKPREYVLFVGRLVPENKVHHLVEAFTQLDTDLKCVIVGGAAYADAYRQHLEKLAGDDPRIVFTGYVFGRGYHELGSNGLVFVETSAVGGTHPAVLEAMAFGNCVIVNDTPENLETIGDAGLGYQGQQGADSLRQVLSSILDDHDRLNNLRNQAKHRAQTVFSWERVTDEYEKLLLELTR